MYLLLSANVLMKLPRYYIFCDAGPPHILHSDNGRKFNNELLFSTLTQKWPTQKIIYGKPPHPESQGAVERANRNIKGALFTTMHDNSNDVCWVKYLRWVQLHKNISYHTCIRMTPYKAVYNKKPSFCLAHFGILHEHWDQINSEQDLNSSQNEIQGILVEDAKESILSYISHSDTDLTPSPPSKFPPLIDHYHDVISLPTPFGTIISEYLPQSSYDYPLENMINLDPSDYNKFSSEPSSELRSVASVTTMNCVACGELTSGAHSCPRCHHYIHSICGRLEGEEGYGSSVVCPACDLAERRIPFDSMRAGIKRNQERLQERMLKTSFKKLKPAEIVDTVVILIAHPDKVYSQSLFSKFILSIS